MNVSSVFEFNPEVCDPHLPVIAWGLIENTSCLLLFLPMYMLCGM